MICIENRRKTKTCYQLRSSAHGFGWDIYQNDGAKWKYCFNAINVSMLAEWLIQKDIAGTVLSSVDDFADVYNDSVKRVEAVLYEAIEAGTIPQGRKTKNTNIV